MKESPPRSTLGILFAAMCIALGLFVNAWELGEEALWLDEHASLDFAGFSFEKCVTAEAQHPPLYRTMLWVHIRLFGSDDDAVLRIPSLLFATAAAIGTWLLARRIDARREGSAAAPIAVLLISFSPFLHYYAQEGRNYALLIALSALSTLAFHRVVTERRGHALYGVLSVLLAMTHYFGACVLLVHELAYWRHGRERIRSWLLVRTVSALCVVPWVLWLTQNLEMQPRDWIGSMTHTLPASITRLFLGYGVVTGGSELGQPPYDFEKVLQFLVPGLLVLPFLALAFRGARSLQGLDRTLTLGPVVLTLLLLLPLTLKANYLTDRYLGFFVPFLLLLVAHGVVGLRGRMRVGATVAVSGITALSIACYLLAPGHLLGYPLRYSKEQWDDAASFAQSHDVDRVRSVIDYTRNVFTRYYEGDQVYGVPIDALDDEVPESVRTEALVISHLDPEPIEESIRLWLTRFELVERMDFPAHSGVKVLIGTRR